MNTLQKKLNELISGQDGCDIKFILLTLKLKSKSFVENNLKKMIESNIIIEKDKKYFAVNKDYEKREAV